ncbi:MAG: hypothetical protein WCS70_07955 [Verrucomicrobiota bacterium]
MHTINRAYSMLVATALIVGCNRSEQKPTPPPAPPAPVQAELPAGHPPIPAPPAQLPAGHPPIDMSQQTLPPGTAADAMNPKWDVPASWQPGKASSMRRASYLVKGDGDKSAEIVVTVFPGDVGGLLANVNRWRGQLGLAPTTAAEIDATTTKLTVAGEPAIQVDFKNDATGTRMIVVTVPHGGNSWFYKLTGPTAIVEAAKAEFVKFTESTKF